MTPQLIAGSSWSLLDSIGRHRLFTSFPLPFDGVYKQRILNEAGRCSSQAGELGQLLPFSKWEQIFKDAMTTAAAIARDLCITA